MQDTLTPRIAFWAGAVIAAIGTLLLVWSIRMIRTVKRRQRLEQHTTGTVVENRVTTGMENSTLVSPVVEFTTKSGQSLRVECTWSTQEKYAVRSRVPIHYDPDKPQRADIVGERDLGPLLLAVFALSTVAFGLVLLLVSVLGVPSGQ